MLWVGLFVAAAVVLCVLIKRAPEMDFEDEEEAAVKEQVLALRERRARRKDHLHYVPLPDLQTPDDSLRV